MITLKEIADPIVDIKDTLETFRLYDIEIENWRETLDSASTQLTAAAGRADDPVEYLALSEKVRFIASHGLDRESPTFQEAARKATALASKIRIPGIPTPDDPDWSF